MFNGHIFFIDISDRILKNVTYKNLKKHMVLVLSISLTNLLVEGYIQVLNLIILLTGSTTQ